MKEILKNLSRRWGHDGWAIKHKRGTVLKWSVCTTRSEARELLDDAFLPSINRENFEVVKVLVSVTPLATEGDTKCA